MSMDIIFAGIGGQGVQTMGTILANAALKKGKEVIFRPAYTGHMRGGKSTCIVQISDEPIFSPAVTDYDMVVALGQPALKALEPSVKKGGILLWETSTIKEPPERKDIRVYRVPAYNIATSDLKNVKVMNMIVLGAMIQINPLVTKESLMESLKETLPDRHHEWLPINAKALDAGMNLIK